LLNPPSLVATSISFSPRPDIRVFEHSPKVIGKSSRRPSRGQPSFLAELRLTRSPCVRGGSRDASSSTREADAPCGASNRCSRLHASRPDCAHPWPLPPPTSRASPP
jgi:hypothetical protein